MEKSRITEMVRISAERALTVRATRPLILWGPGADAALSDAEGVPGMTVVAVSGAERLSAALRRACPDADASLGAALISAARAARQAGAPLMVLVRDLAAAESEDIGDLVQALHEVSQSGVPLVFLGDGGPHAHRRLGEARDYAETLFTFVSVDAEPEDTPRP